MKTKVIPLLLGCAVLCLALGTKAGAAVNFTSSITNANLTPGGSFTLNLSLDITGGEDVTGVSYFLTQESGPSSNVFSITGYSLGSSVFSVANSTDPTASPGNMLNSSDAYDLGAGLANVNNPVSNGIYSLASITISIGSTAGAGTYDISPTFESGIGTPNGDWVDASFNDNNISSQLVVPVKLTVAPEAPTPILLLAGTCLLVVTGWRRRFVR
jgi:hypothetical protein